MGPVYLNGSFVDADAATVSAFDHGVTTGDGVFESVVVRAGAPFYLDRHLERLCRSAAVLGLRCPPPAELGAAARRTVALSGLTTGRLRITLTAGRGPLGSARGDSAPTVIIACSELGEVPERAVVVVAPWPKNERSAIAGAKTTSYAENVVALAHATERGASEALFCNTAGNLCEGTGSNVFLGIEGELVTPPLSAGCLAGVTRGLILEVTGALERDVAREELATVEEAFLSSTTRGVQPIESLDGRLLASCPGPLTRAAEAAFVELVGRAEDLSQRSRS